MAVACPCPNPEQLVFRPCRLHPTSARAPCVRTPTRRSTPRGCAHQVIPSLKLQFIYSGTRAHSRRQPDTIPRPYQSINLNRSATNHHDARDLATTGDVGDGMSSSPSNPDLNRISRLPCCLGSDGSLWFSVGCLASEDEVLLASELDGSKATLAARVSLLGCISSCRCCCCCCPH